MCSATVSSSKRTSCCGQMPREARTSSTSVPMSKPFIVAEPEEAGNRPVGVATLLRGRQQGQQDGNREQQDGNREQQDGNREQQVGNGEQQDGNGEQQDGNRWREVETDGERWKQLLHRMARGGDVTATCDRMTGKCLPVA